MFITQRKSGRGFTPIKSGFTLIELLISIAIIGILTAFGTFSFQNALSKARDAQRKNDLRQLKTALEAYYIDWGVYPPDPAWCDSSKNVVVADCAGYGGNVWTTGGISILAPKYIQRMPLDPRNDATYYYYYEPVIGQTQFGLTCGAGDLCGYVLSAQLENSNDSQANPGCMTTIPALNYCVGSDNVTFGL